MCIKYFDDDSRLQLVAVNPKMWIESNIAMMATQYSLYKGGVVDSRLMVTHAKGM